MQNIKIKSYAKCPKLPWMIDFHSTAHGTILNQQMKAAYASTHLEHLSNLNYKSKLPKVRLTKLICAIPKYPTIALILDLLQKGMTVAIIKIFNYTPQECQDTVDIIRSAVVEFGTKIGIIFPLAIAFDVTKPEIYTGKLKPPRKEIELEKGLTTKITSDSSFENVVTKHKIYVSEDLGKFVQPGDDIQIGPDIHLSALEVAKEVINCIVERAGRLIDNLEVKISDTPVVLPPPTMDEENLEMARKLKVDFVMVGEAILDDTILTLGQSPISIYTKIETSNNLQEIDDILEKSDGILIDPENLVLDLKEQVFIVQKSVIAKANKLGKPVIAVVSYKEISKSHILDISNTVMDGVDALLLPPIALEKVSSICKNAEASVYQKELFNNLLDIYSPPVEPMTSVTIAAVEASLKCNAAAIIVLTTSGRSVKTMSRFRPKCPIIAVTRYRKVARQLQMYRGVVPLVFPKPLSEVFLEEVDMKVQIGITYGKFKGYIKMGDALVIVTGSRPTAGFTNTMKIVYASEHNTTRDCP